ncbi:hypothetical protein GCM10027445_26740 [Amycolatopsis endophytica]
MATFSGRSPNAHCAAAIGSRAHGRCAILVDNGGIFPFVDISELTYDTWRRVLSVNLDSQFLMTQAVLPVRF